MFKGGRSGRCWCHWIKERSSLVGCKCVYYVKLYSLCTTVYNCVHCVQLYASVQFCTIRVLFLVLLLWSYSRQKLFFSLISFTLCHVQLSKSSKMLHVNNRQSEPNANNVLGVYECFWIFKDDIWKKVSAKSLKFCGFFKPSLRLNKNLKFGISTHHFGLQLQCTSEHILVTNLLFSFPLPHFRSDNGFCHARLLVEFVWISLPFIATFRIASVKIVTRYGPI